MESNLATWVVRRLLALLPWHAPIHTVTASRSFPGKSIFARHLDCGSCNACELEIQALFNPIYDVEQFGVQLVSSPRHADVLLLTGPFTRNMADAASRTFEGMSFPRKIIGVGDCTRDGGIYKGSYALVDRPPDIEQAIAAHVPGCPPSPQQILEALNQLKIDA